MGRQLQTHERSTFELVARAAFANPFSGERHALDLQLAGATSHSGSQTVAKAVATVRDLFAAMASEGRAIRSVYNDSQDRALLQNAALFLVFHEHIDDLDKLIQAQLQSGERSLPVTFSSRLIQRLLEFDFSESEAHRTLAIFFQIRRAFFFINHSLVGFSRSMIQLRCQLWDNVFTHDMDLYNTWFWNRMEDFSTLLVGETGTGKGTAAAAVGRSAFIPFDPTSNRFKASFINAFLAINLVQFPETLLEAELFGYRKGAFTGAVESHLGILARCSPYGAIFLDEVGEVSADIQVKLLKVLEEREFTPVGSHQGQQFRGRIIAATNRDPDRLRAAGSLRDDFYYRLSSDVIPIPPLRQRIAEDKRELDLLLRHLVTRIAGDADERLIALCRNVIETDLGPNYAWPGNVRELSQCVRRILITRHYRPSSVARTPEDGIWEPLTHENHSASFVLGAYASALYQREGSYQRVARIMELDRRTVKRYIDIYRAK